MKLHSRIDVDDVLHEHEVADFVAVDCHVRRNKHLPTFGVMALAMAAAVACDSP